MVELVNELVKFPTRELIAELQRRPDSFGILAEVVEVLNQSRQPQKQSVAPQRAKRYTGTVKSWNIDFGFAVVENLPTDVFIHWTELRGGARHFRPNQQVTFEIICTDKGLAARNARAKQSHE